MENVNALRRCKKDELVDRLVETSKLTSELNEKILGAAIIGGIAGFLVGVALVKG